MGIYSNQQLEFLRAEYPKRSRADLTKAFNTCFGMDKTEAAIKAVLKKHGIHAGRTGAEANRVNNKGKSKLFTSEQVDFIKANYADLGRKGLLSAIKEQFGLDITLQQLVSFVKNNKIHSGRTGYFQKGVPSWSKGTKGVLKANAGSFKKGHKPCNKKPIGHERTDPRSGYILVKVAEKNPWDSSKSGWYRAKHNVVWEKHHGQIQDGMCIRFRDGNSKNCTIENLVMVTRAEHIRLTQMNFAQQAEEVKPLILNIAKVEQAAYERSKSI